MSAVPTATFEDRLSSLDQEAFCEFVAAVWAASGWETTVESPLVIARKDDREQRLLVAPASRVRRLLSFDAPEDIDTVVSPRVEEETHLLGLPDTPVVDATDLRHRLLYALDDETAARICRDQLDIDLRGGYGEAGSRVRLREAALAVLALGLVAAGVVTLLGAGPLDTSAQPVEATGETTFDGGYDADVTPATASTTLEQPQDVPAGNIAYVTTRNGSVRALNAATGETVWQQELVDATPQSTAESSHRLPAPIVKNGTVYVSAFRGVFALDARTGAIQWRDRTATRDTGQPTVIGGVVYLADGPSILAIDADEGTQHWETNLPSTVHGTPTVKGDTVYTASEDGIVYALDAETGEKQFSGAVQGVSFRARSGVVSESDGVDESYLVAGVERMYAFDTETGAQRWSFDVPWTILGSAIDSPPRAATANSREHGTVYLSTTSAGVFALNATTGEQRWLFDEYRDRRFLTPTVATWTVVENGTERASNRTVFVPSEQRDGNGTLHALATATGEEQWAFEPPTGRPLAVTVADGIVYTPATSGRLYALNASTGDRRFTHNATAAGGVSVPTVVRSPFGGDSVDSAVELGTDGHLDSRYTRDTGSGGIRLSDHEQPGTVAPGEEGRLSITVANTGRNQTAVTVELDAAWNDDVVTRRTTLDSATATQYTATFEAPTERGPYEYDLRVGNKTVSGQATVVDPPRHDIVGVDAQSAVYRGDLTEVLVTVRNVDNVSGTTPMALEFDGEIVDRTARTVSANETVTVTLSFEPGETLRPGNYTLAVATGDDVHQQTLEIRAVGDSTLARSLAAQIVGAMLLVMGVAVAWWLLTRRGIVQRLAGTESESGR